MVEICRCFLKYVLKSSKSTKFSIWERHRVSNLKVGITITFCAVGLIYENGFGNTNYKLRKVLHHIIVGIWGRDRARNFSIRVFDFLGFFIEFEQ